MVVVGLTLGVGGAAARVCVRGKKYQVYVIVANPRGMLGE